MSKGQGVYGAYAKRDEFLKTCDVRKANLTLGDGGGGDRGG
jgi:hypothetical protein